jgi:hypothetical protein
MDRSLTSSALGARGGAPTPGRGAAASAGAAAASRGVQQRAPLLSSSAAGGRPAASAMPTARERRAAVDRLDAELLSELKEAFQLFDSDEDGAIDAKELKAAFKALGVDVKTADVRRMLGGACARRAERSAVAAAVTCCLPAAGRVGLLCHWVRPLCGWA